jgi:pilus assembly protein Flp/PilA
LTFRRLLRNDRGAAAVEYALIAVLISTAAIAGMQTLGLASSNAWQSVLDKIATVLGY